MSGRGPSFTCGIVTCYNETAIGCTGPEASLECKCFLESFYGPTCDFNLFASNPKSFLAYHVSWLLLYLGLTAVSFYVLVFYFRSFRPKMTPKPSLLSSQFVAIFAIAFSSFWRLVYSCVVLSIGRDFMWRFYLNPNAVQIILRISSEMTYPALACAYTIQILWWLDMLLKVKMMKSGESIWVWTTFAILMAIIFSFQLTVIFLVAFRIGSSVYLYYAYRSILLIYSLFLLGITIIFGVRFIRISKDSNSELEGSAAARAADAKRNLNRMVILTAFALALTVLVLVVALAVPITGAYTFFIPRIFLFICVISFGLIITLTFLSMMKRRIEMVHGSGRAMTTTQDLQQPLIDPEDAEADL